MIEVDPRIEQTFADVLVRSRHRAADITDRLAAKQRELEERSKQIKDEGQQLTRELDRRVAEKLESAQNNPWQSRESKPTVLAFGDEDEGGRNPVPAAPAMSTPPAPGYPPPTPAAPEPAPEPEPSKRFLAFEVEEDEAERRRPTPQPPARPAAPAGAGSSDDEDDDYSGRSWVR